MGDITVVDATSALAVVDIDSVVEVVNCSADIVSSDEG